MNFKKYISNYLFDPKNINSIRFIFGFCLSALLSFLILKPQGGNDPKSSQAFAQNINVMIPKDHVLFPFTAQNFNEIDAVLEAYSLVQVYDVEKGRLLAENIKVLRAPKSPTQLAFLIPSHIASSFMNHGMDFRLALQKFTNDEPRLITKKRPNLKKVVTYGQKK